MNRIEVLKALPVCRGLHQNRVRCKLTPESVPDWTASCSERDCQWALRCKVNGRSNPSTSCWDVHTHPFDANRQGGRDQIWLSARKPQLQVARAARTVHITSPLKLLLNHHLATFALPRDIARIRAEQLSKVHQRSTFYCMKGLRLYQDDPNQHEMRC
jgi:hypothetical protein